MRERSYTNIVKLYESCETKIFLAVCFARFHIHPLDGETPETRAIYYNRSVREGIVYL